MNEDDKIFDCSRFSPADNKETTYSNALQDATPTNIINCFKKAMDDITKFEKKKRERLEKLVDRLKKDGYYIDNTIKEKLSRIKNVSEFNKLIFELKRKEV